MMTISFDMLKLADKLQAGGFTSDQARAAASALAEALSGTELATKTDLKTEVHDLEQRFTIRFRSMLVVATGIILAAIRYLPIH
jgi:hypothetical protein